MIPTLHWHQRFDWYVKFGSTTCSITSLNLYSSSLKKENIFSELNARMSESDPPLMDSSDCYATWSGPPTEDRGSVAPKGKTVGFEKQNSVDQDMVREKVFSWPRLGKRESIGFLLTSNGAPSAERLLHFHSFCKIYQFLTDYFPNQPKFC